jgi:outer membrane murein-binding lipoprotein Lpp
VLLLTLSAQVTRISQVVGAMNTHFSAISLRMDEITSDLGSMESEVARLAPIAGATTTMRGEMIVISQATGQIQNSMLGIGQQMGGTRANVEYIANTMGAMNQEVQAMSAEMHRIAKPARTLNRMFPFP